MFDAFENTLKILAYTLSPGEISLRYAVTGLCAYACNFVSQNLMRYFHCPSNASKKSASYHHLLFNGGLVNQRDHYPIAACVSRCL